MPVYQLTAAWQKVASAGQAVEVENQSVAPAYIMTSSSGPPLTLDGLELWEEHPSEQLALTADLYARCDGTRPVTLEVMAGLSLGQASGSSSAAPANTVLPAITGTAQVGQTLTASTGTWTGSPTAYAYQWLRSGTAIPGATTSTYAPASADIGATLACTVTATNATGSASATSAATAVVSGSAAGGGPNNTADFTNPNNAYLAALMA